MEEPGVLTWRRKVPSAAAFAGCREAGLLVPPVFPVGSGTLSRVSLQGHLDALNAVAHPRIVEQAEPTLRVVLDLVAVHLQEQDERGRAASERSTAARDDRWAADQPPRVAAAPLAARDRATLQLFAAGSHLRSAAVVYRSEGVYPYSPLVVLRAAVEAAAWAHWLSDTTVTSGVRVGRSLTEQIHDQWQMRMWGDEPQQARSRQVTEDILNEAAAAGLDTFRPAGRKARRKPPHVGEERPTSTAVMDQLLPHEEGAGLVGGLGKATQWYLSMIVHSAGPGLYSVLDQATVQQDGTGHLVGALVVSSRTIVSMMTLGALGFMTGANSYRDLVGWKSDAWTEACVRLATHWRRIEPML